MAELLPTDLESIRARDAASAETWFKGPAGIPAAFGACGRAFVDRRWLLGEIERLAADAACERAERESWQAIAAGRNVRIALIAEERDRLKQALLEAACFCGPTDTDPRTHDSRCVYRRALDVEVPISSTKE